MNYGHNNNGAWTSEVALREAQLRHSREAEALANNGPAVIYSAESPRSSPAFPDIIADLRRISPGRPFPAAPQEAQGPVKPFQGPGVVPMDADEKGTKPFSLPEEPRGDTHMAAIKPTSATATTAEAEVVGTESSVHAQAARAFAGDFATAAARGAKVGAAQSINSTLVKGFTALFPASGLASMVIDTPVGQQVLRLAVPFSLGITASLFPSFFPNTVSAEMVRRVCLYAAEGEAAQLIQPMLAKMGGLLRTVIAQGVSAGVPLDGLDSATISEARRWAEEQEREDRRKAEDDQRRAEEAAREVARRIEQEERDARLSASIAAALAQALQQQEAKATSVINPS